MTVNQWKLHDHDAELASWRTTWGRHRIEGKAIRDGLDTMVPGFWRISHVAEV